ncbi:ABC transporter substrate-binding protein [Aureimonas pseudogalii]|uniref:Branched-chain amino acid transport system substrate-binding protein n=1 Tax=Aureimonas pseudogalii TaxID=1744844 RepID=A0A7W6H7Z1_9HYPH|nr:ABC transporter substrate-binding protein [Aureimonas pseudogalii]MBB4000263.1 branched-chain amino acid transport system substrate-binding protein [Aureimonas pseudogalii]
MKLDRRQALQMMAAGTLAAAMPRTALAQGAEYRIGALCPITGAGSTFGTGMQKMIVAAAAEINAAGGAAGRTLTVFQDDTQTQPQAAVLAAKKLLEVNEVQAILGTWSSGVSLAVIPLCNDAGAILMNTSGAPALSVAPANAKHLSYRFQATNDRFGRAFAEIAKREGFKKPATMAFNNASGIGNTEGFAKAWKADGGTVEKVVVYEPNQPSYRSELQSVLDGEPDVIVMGSYVADTAIILREWFQSGATNKFIIPRWAFNVDTVATLGPEVMANVITVESVANESSPAFAAFDALYRKEMGEPGTANNYAAMTYDMTVLLALAIEAAGPGADNAAINAKIVEVSGPDGEVVTSFAAGRDALKAGKSINYDGASSVLDLDAFGDVTPDFGAFFFEGDAFQRRYVVQI